MLEDLSSDEVLREESSHGEIWNNMHGGYFSSLDIAAPHIAKIAEAIKLSSPDVVVDLGGGTGFILDLVSKTEQASDVELIDLDLSEEQLGSIRNEKIIPQKGSIASFRREELNYPDKKFLFTSRSTLHYSGQKGLVPVVKHIREQMKPGEFFVHQTACFGTEEDASIMNLLYAMMGTDKWYPQMKSMCEILEKDGFEVVEISKVPALELTSDSLMKRYDFSNHRRQEIIDAVLKDFGKEKEGVFCLTPDGFTAYLHYMVFTCKAAC